MSYVINVDGTRTEVEPADKVFSVEELQKHVGGYVTPVPGTGGMILADEDGLLKFLPRNNRASEMCGMPLCGPVLVVTHRKHLG